jgi:hypothetical protein
MRPHYYGAGQKILCPGDRGHRGRCNKWLATAPRDAGVKVRVIHDEYECAPMSILFKCPRRAGKDIPCGVLLELTIEPVPLEAA